ncbi:MAG: hypothetical protein K8953_07445, partial [Proteobacteria bacterium]|nr:hypothetical protein [Pseudomonadota bacterium]
YYHRNSRGEDIIVSPSDTTYTDCDGNVLAQGSKIPICRGGGSPAYTIWYNDLIVPDGHGNPSITTDTKQTSGRLTIDASFSRLGLIHGAINIETGFLDGGNLIGKRGGDLISSSGTLVGRINADQLFAAFASNAGSAEAYAGGFTATPSATPSPTRFTSGGTDDLTFTDIDEAADATESAPHPLGITSNEDYVIDGTTSGFALASENIANDKVNLYAGILTGTNLGNPLFDNGATGTWNAKLNLIMLGGTATANFDLNVDFNARTIKTYANRPAEFSLAGVDFEVVQRSDANTQTVLLTNPGASESDPRVTLYLQDENNRDNDDLVTASDIGTEVRPTNCATGAALNIGDRIPLCEGGGNPIYKRDAAGMVEVHAQTKKRIFEIETVSATGRLIVNGRFSSTGKISGSTNIQVGQITEFGDLINKAGEVVRVNKRIGQVVSQGGEVVIVGLTSVPIS